MPPGLYVGLSSGNVGIGTTGIAGTSNLVNVNGKDVYIGANTGYASYTRYGSNLSVPSADGMINGVSITALNKRTRTSGASAVDCVSTWTVRTPAVGNDWRAVCWAPEVSLFVAVARTGTGNRVMTSPDGIIWTGRTSAADNEWWSVCWSPELLLFVAVARSGTGDRVMTSSNGIAWTVRTSAADNEWYSVCWSPELLLFVAVARSGTGNRVMTSPNGITWTSRTSASDNNWISVCWASELSLFVAVADTGTGNRVMTSTNGITWISRTSAADNAWRSVCWSPELSLLVAVAYSGTGNRVMTSPDGVTWTARASAANNAWVSVCWSPEISLFVAISDTGIGGCVMTSPDGFTWTVRISDLVSRWLSVCWSSELSLFLAVAGNNRGVMTSAIGMPNSKSVVKALPSQMMVTADGNVGIGTTSPSAILDINGSIKLNNQILNTNNRPILKQTGSVINVIYADFSFVSTTTNTAFIANMNATITPSTSSSKILIQVYIKGLRNGGTTSNYVLVFLYRGSSISLKLVGDDIGYSVPNNTVHNISGAFLDSPNTTSVVTYQLYANHTSASGIPFLWRNGSIVLTEISG